MILALFSLRGREIHTVGTENSEAPHQGGEKLRRPVAHE